MSLNTIRDLQESRGKKIAEMRSINDKAQGEKRDLSGEERKRFDALGTEVRGLNARLSDAEKLAEFERLEARGDDVSGNAVARQTLEGYSLAKALMESRSSGLTGLEAEWHQELASGRAEVRGVMVPTQIILGGEARALTTTTPGTGPGSNLIATDLASMTERRRAALKIESMGATVMRGLTGNMDLPHLNSSGAAGWIAEHTDTTRSDADFSKKSMDPKTVAAEYELSRRMLLQSSVALDPTIRADPQRVTAYRCDHTTRGWFVRKGHR